MGMMKRSSLLSFISPFVVLPLLCINHSAIAACQEPACDDEFGEVDQSWDINLRCNEIEVLQGNWTSVSDEDCLMYQQTYHLCYWCAQGESDLFCRFRNVECPSRPLSEDTNVTETCAELQNDHDAGILPSSTEKCILAEEVTFACPIFCGDNDDIITAYLGADTEAKKKALVWTPRVIGLLSFFGASFILIEVLINKKKRGTLLHQLIFGMALFDLSTAGAWAFASAPLPRDEAWNIYGASGTSQTCTAQGFFIQLGFTSVFYNMSLALHYFLVITRRWRESDLQKIKVYLHGFPLLLGFGLAFGAIPRYDWIEYSCHLEVTPLGDLWAVLVFVVVPIGTAILVITGLMLAIFLTVRQQARTSRKWRFGIGKDSSMEREVFWQCFWYTFVFYVTWPHVFAVYTASVDIGNYPAAYLYAFLAPLQGFNNFLVYVRLRLMERAREIAENVSARHLFQSKPQQYQPDDHMEESPSMPTSKQDKNTM